MAERVMVVAVNPFHPTASTQPRITPAALAAHPTLVPTSASLREHPALTAACNQHSTLAHM